MNAETYARDVKEVRAGRLPALRLDLAARRRAARARTSPSSACRSRKMCNESFSESRERILMKNIVYVGALAALLDIDMDVIDELLDEKFAKKKALLRVEPQGASSSATTTRRSTSSARCRSASRRWTPPTTAS